MPHENESLRVARSHTGNHFGLFAKVDFKRGDLVTKFMGDFCTEQKLKELSHAKPAPRIKCIDDRMFVCAENDLASYAVDAINFPANRRNLLDLMKTDAPFYNKCSGVDYNADARIFNGQPILEARRDISAGAEICIHQGFEHWFCEEAESRGFGIPIDYARIKKKQIYECESFAAYVRAFYGSDATIKLVEKTPEYDLVLINQPYSTVSCRIANTWIVSISNHLDDKHKHPYAIYSRGIKGSRVGGSM